MQSAFGVEHGVIAKKYQFPGPDHKKDPAGYDNYMAALERKDSVPRMRAGDHKRRKKNIGIMAAGTGVGALIGRRTPVGGVLGGAGGLAATSVPLARKERKISSSRPIGKP